MKLKTIAAFKRVIGSREDLSEACFRNGYVLPKITSSICTEDYLTKVMEGKVYCPKDSELNSKNWYAAPCKSSLIAKLKKVAKDQKLSFGHDEKHLPDKSWIVKMLGHLLPADEIFDKDYVPPPINKKKDEPKVISLPSRFLKGLPTKPISKRRLRVRLKLTMDGNKKVKELSAKEKKDALRIEI